jgi:hypothetical protein
MHNGEILLEGKCHRKMATLFPSLFPHSLFVLVLLFLLVSWCVCRKSRPPRRRYLPPLYPPNKKREPKRTSDLLNIPGVMKHAH